MELHLRPETEVTLRQQIVTQVVLAIASGELEQGQRLPSTRALARRHKIHPNTVSAAYQQLVREGWLLQHRGAQVLVAPREAESDEGGPDLAGHLIGALFRRGRTCGVPSVVLRAAMRVRLSRPEPTAFLVVDPDPELRALLIWELQGVLRSEIRGVSPTDAHLQQLARTAVVLAMPSKISSILRTLGPDVDYVPLQIQSVQAELSMHRMPTGNSLVAVASRWAGFLEFARSILVAIGCHPDAILLRNATEHGWNSGLTEADFVICDSSLRHLLPGERVLAFELLSVQCRDELVNCDKFMQMHSAQLSSGDVDHLSPSAASVR